MPLVDLYRFELSAADRRLHVAKDLCRLAARSSGVIVDMDNFPGLPIVNDISLNGISPSSSRSAKFFAQSW